MIIIGCCITIFITYILIFGLLTYYFIKHRVIWNDLFNINNIINTLIEIFVCPEHFIIYIPGIVFENTPCVEKTLLKNENKEKYRIILTKINKIFKKMKCLENNDMNNDSNSCNSGNSGIEQVKWILEGTIENFNHMYEETADFYNKLSGSYEVLGKKINTNNIDSISDNATNLITLENYVLIENNVEHCDTILSLLELIDNRDNKDTMFQIENTYMVCLIYNLIESVKIYKLSLLKKLSF